MNIWPVCVNLSKEKFHTRTIDFKTSSSGQPKYLKSVLIPQTYYHSWLFDHLYPIIIFYGDPMIPPSQNLGIMTPGMMPMFHATNLPLNYTL